MIEFYRDIIAPILANKIVQSIIIGIMAWVLCRFLRGRIGKIVKKRDDQRISTLFGVLSKAVSAAVYFIAALFILQILFGISPSSVIAATGIVSVALGLGAQSLVKDSINGFFVLLENQYAVGDMVTIGDFCGTVADITLRMTCVENFQGDRLYIPNGTIDRVINHSQADRSVVIDVGVSYDEDIEKARAAMEEILEEAFSELSYLTKKPQILGVTMLGASAVNIRALAFCAPGDQFMTERELLERVREGLRERGIQIPYNHLVVVEEKGKQE